nr:homocysteine S-methyltransferase family protein [Novosphingobium sp.]
MTHPLLILDGGRCGGQGRARSLPRRSDPRRLRRLRPWDEAGASILGGCCGIGPEHIAALAARQG